MLAQRFITRNTTTLLLKQQETFKSILGYRFSSKSSSPTLLPSSSINQLLLICRRNKYGNGLNNTIMRNNSRLLSSSSSSNAMMEKKPQRPMSPHLTIYNWQLTNTMSIFHRATGAALGVGIYATALTYAIVPFDSAILAAYVHSLPSAALLLGKALIAYPFVYHTCTGIRHLIWDAGKALTLKGVYTTGYIALAATALIGTGILFV